MARKHKRTKKIHGENKEARYDMGFEQWIRRIKHMQVVLPKMTDGGEKYEIEDLIDNAIAPNLKREPTQ